MHIKVRYIITKTIISLSVVIVALTMATSLFASSNDWDKEANKRKAAYIFLEATNQYENNKIGQYYSLLNRAYELDSIDTSIGYEKGMIDMILFQEDSVTFFNAHALARRHFDAHPEDYYSSYKYGAVTDKIGWRKESLRVWETLDSIFPEKIEITLRYADVLSASADTADIAKAVATYNRIEVAEGKNVGITSRKIRAYSAIKDSANIINELNAILESSPNSSEYNVFAGQIYDYLGDENKALWHLNKACELDPTNGNAFFQRANYYLVIGDSIAYDNEVFNVLKHDDLDLEAKLQLLTGYIRELYNDPTQQGRIEELLSVLLEQHPHQYHIHELYSAYLATIKDFPRAAEQLSYALDIDPSNENTWIQYISLCSQTYDAKIVNDAVNRGIHYFPDNPVILYQAGLSQQLLYNDDEALKYFHRTISLSDNNLLLSSAYCSIGDILQKNKKIPCDSVSQYYELSLNANPDNLLTLNNYAYYLATQETDLDKAERMSARAVTEDPENINSLDTYAWIFFKKKNYEMARQHIETALKYEEEPSAELHHHAGDIYFMCGEPEMALEHWEQALAIEPNNELLQKKVKHKTFFYE